MTIESARQLEIATRQMRFPLFAKPGDKSQTTVHDFKARTSNSPTELRTASQFGEGLLFQTYHRGQGVGIEV